MDEVWFSYSDVTHNYVMNKASEVIGWGPHFGVCSATKTMIAVTKPVIAITARTHRRRQIADHPLRVAILKDMGKKVVAIRHPMPYGDLAKQACQRFETYEDLDRHECTIEEREEYEPHIDNGFVVYAGVDYETILREAEKEADVILWDGGNNDTPFYKPDLHITLVDPHRPGHELSYYPGETNLRICRSADRQQGRHRRPGEGREGDGQLPQCQPRGTVDPVPLGRSPSTTPSSSRASGRWSSRTARP